MTERAWLDEGEVPAGWAPPVGRPVHRSRFRGPLAYAVVAVALALVVGLVHLAGGFERRTDRFDPVAPGALITTGPFELSFTEATLQPREDGDGRRTSWQLTIVGQARTNGDEAISPPVYLDPMFAVRVPGRDPVWIPEGADLGTLGEYAFQTRRELTPGLPPIDYRLTFRLPPDLEPPPTVRLGVDELVFSDQLLVSDEKSWNGTGSGWVVELPVRVLPARS